MATGNVAAAAPLNADRPGFSFSAGTVAAGRVVAETGYQYTDDNAGLHQFPVTSVRVGVRDGLELRLDWGGHNWSAADAAPTGTGDVSVGMKAVAWRSDRAMVGALLLLSLPAGDDEFSSGGYDPTLALPYTVALSETLSLFGTASVASVSAPGAARRWQATSAIGLARTLTDELGVFVETYSVLAEDTEPAHTIDMGITIAPRGGVQLDLNGGIGLVQQAADAFVGAGVVWRW